MDKCRGGLCGDMNESLRICTRGRSAAERMKEERENFFFFFLSVSLFLSFIRSPSSHPTKSHTMQNASQKKKKKKKRTTLSSFSGIPPEEKHSPLFAFPDISSFHNDP